MNLWKILLSLVVLPIVLGLSGCQEAIAPQTEAIAVQQVLSGQEFELVGIPGQPDITEQVRLAGIAAPSLTQEPWGNAAKTQLEQMIGSQSVMLESDVRTEQGRRSVYAWLNGTLLNEKLVAEGYALVTVSKPPKSKYELRLTRAQDRARILGLGIWIPQDPMRQISGQNTRE
ncbi:MAG: thermonuclease family protein [Phormidesmis sp. CAN_BIN36]|nr:thermonuclease family protein [Phormidesmis sp. CAN_BIN36]